MRWFALFIILLIPSIALSATGDLIFSCNFGGTDLTPQEAIEACGMTSAQSGGLPYFSDRPTRPSTGGWDNGPYIRFNQPSAASGDTGEGVGYEPFATPGLDKNEITIEYWERYSIAQSVEADWNCKGVRPLSASDDGTNYIAETVTRNGDHGPMFAHLDGGTTMVTTAVNDFNATYPNYSVWPGSPTGYCGGSYTVENTPASAVGTSYCGRYALIGNHHTDSDWHKVRMHVKHPTNASSNSKDGVIHYWIDDVLIATLTNINGMSPTSTNIGKVRFHPQDGWKAHTDTKAAYAHDYDDIKIYEGYVPPSGAGSFSSLHGISSASGVTFR